MGGNAPRYRVLIADKRRRRRANTRRALEGHGFAVCAEVSDVDDLIPALRSEPDVCLVDAWFAREEASVAARISKRLPQTVVVVHGEPPSESEFYTAIFAGVRGFVPRTASAERLPVVLRAVLRGELALTRRAARRLLEEFQRRQR